MKLMTLFILFYSCLLEASSLPARWRFEYNAGKANTHYVEDQPSILFTAKDVKQESLYQEFIYSYFLAPPWLDFSLGATLTGLQYDSPEEEEDRFSYITAFTNLGALIPITDYIQFKLVFEYFYTTMIVEDDAFGFKGLSGSQVYPELEFLPYGSKLFFNIAPYFKFPLWSDVGGRKETTVGLKLRIPLGALGEQRFPTFAYQSALLIKLFYSQMNLEFEKEGFIKSEIEVKQYGLTLGFTF